VVASPALVHLVLLAALPGRPSLALIA